jgi:hypothetical protein
MLKIVSYIAAYLVGLYSLALNCARLMGKRFLAFMGLTFLLLPMSSHAAMDVAGALAGFADVNTAVPVVGAAFLLALGILAAWKLIRGAFA